MFCNKVIYDFTHYKFSLHPATVSSIGVLLSEDEGYLHFIKQRKE